MFIYAVCEQLVVRKFILCGVKGIRPNDLRRQEEGRSSRPFRLLYLLKGGSVLPTDSIKGLEVNPSGQITSFEVSCQ